MFSYFSSHKMLRVVLACYNKAENFPTELNQSVKKIFIGYWQEN